MKSTARKTLSKLSLSLYAFASLGGGMTDFPIAIFLIPFYSEVIGLSPALIGWLALIPGIYDAITDPFSGNISDRTRSRFGRRRFWILLGSIPLGLSFWWLFAPLRGMEAASFLIAYLFFFTFMDFVFIPQMAMRAELSADYDERTRIQGYNRAFWIIGLLQGVFIPMILGGIFPDKRASYALMGLIMGAFIAGAGLITFFGTRENPAFWRDTHVSLSEGLKAIGQNKNFMLLIICNGLYSIGCAIPNTLLIYYALNWLKVPEADVLAAVPIYLVASVLSVPVWVALSKKIQKKPTYILAFITAGIGGLFCLFIPRGQVLPLYFIFVIAGAGYGGLMAIPGAMVADVIDLDEYKTGDRREGVFFGVWEFFRKFAHNIAIWLVMQILALIGYVQQTQQTPQVENGIRLMFALLPMFFYFTGAVVISFFNYNKEEVEKVQQMLRSKVGPERTATPSEPTPAPPAR
ncbi:MAG: MFS transporter [Anaerolineales bacterium]|nr:MFS transporter [Anaerolineales bacterium]